MLRINRETDYAIRVILALAKYPPDQIITSAVIQREMHLPEALSLQIISRLANRGLVKTYPGRNGGIQLAQAPAEISLREVVEAMEGPLTISYCLTDDHTCSLAPDCPVQGCWEDLQEKINRELEEVNFQILSQG